MQSDWIWMNGKFIPWDEANIHVTAHALHYGTSVFEGIRAYSTPDGPAIFRLHDHTNRLIKGCKILRLELPYTQETLNTAIIKTVQKNQHTTCYIRPLAFRGSGKLGVDGRQNPVEVVIFSFEWGAYLGTEALEQGVDVQVTSWQRMAPN
ncbi:MAG: branched chain amino acid aminotransferase, partial [Phototrophicales bacterium]